MAARARGPASAGRRRTAVAQGAESGGQPAGSVGEEAADRAEAAAVVCACAVDGEEWKRQTFFQSDK